MEPLYWSHVVIVIGDVPQHASIYPGCNCMAASIAVYSFSNGVKTGLIRDTQTQNHSLHILMTYKVNIIIIFQTVPHRGGAAVQQ